jgi:hypothetical protein
MGVHSEQQKGLQMKDATIKGSHAGAWGRRLR